MVRKNEDLLDEIFSGVAKGVFDNETTAEFQRRLNESLSKNGYANVGDLINKGIDQAVKFVGPNAQFSGFERPKEVKDGLTYVQNELANIRYDMRKRGLYRDGHQEALRFYYQQMLSQPDHIQALVPIIKEEKKNRLERLPKRDRYGEGYVEALDDLLYILESSKKYMMQKVRVSLG